jgi:hypothetical protein
MAPQSSLRMCRPTRDYIVRRKVWALLIAVIATSLIIKLGGWLVSALLHARVEVHWLRVLSLSGGLGFLIPAVALPIIFARRGKTLRSRERRAQTLPGATRFGARDHQS